MSQGTLPRESTPHFSPENVLFSMGQNSLDDVDRGIIHALQEDARHATIESVGDRVGVSASTVRNRINDMEAAGVIRGYHPEIDYGRAGFDLRVLFRGRLDSSDGEHGIPDEVFEIDGVVGTRHLLGCERNVVVEVVGRDPAHVESVHDQLLEAGIRGLKSEYVREAETQPFDHFGSGETSG